MFPHWRRVSLAEVPFDLAARFDAVSAASFQTALLLATILPWAIALWSVWRPLNDLARRLVLLVQATVVVNVIWHILIAGAILQSYSPGLATAATLNLPFSILFYRQAFREQWCSRRETAALAPAAVLMHTALLVALVCLGR